MAFPGDIPRLTVDELIRQDSLVAAKLHFLGIPFYEFPGTTLEEACNRKGLRIELVIRELMKSAEDMHPAEETIVSWPVDLITGCLTHAHSVFTRKRLPYLAELIRNCPVRNNVVADLNILFPVFAEDFVHHIHMEEDRLFRYIGKLKGALNGNTNPAALHMMMEKDSIHRYVVEHEAHDDEMEGIRKITSDYILPPGAPLHLEVLYAHLQQLERELRTHARIENEILFPKAATLEARVRTRLGEIARLN